MLVPIMMLDSDGLNASATGTLVLRSTTSGLRRDELVLILANDIGVCTRKDENMVTFWSQLDRWKPAISIHPVSLVGNCEYRRSGLTYTLCRYGVNGCKCSVGPSDLSQTSGIP